ncbi:dolichyl P Man:Man(7)GlcNAc(2) PP dolichyl [Trichuris trichiura]|uniref:Dolichyl P Man:Man(7)GlcNAc(2) PP dolichyl n=1 Tax=Trichuris trichiura TaxID=36087 RepID=A0A077YWC9_TRITR|nr:dolichyl P Man:Man(7)GlcNAc(2) PP dolichyl [Trichuris trichiura]
MCRYKWKAVVVASLWIFSLIQYGLKLPFVEQEEAQYVQALHDILYHGFNLEQYAHFRDADVVPFSFVGPLYLATLTYPALLLNRFEIMDKSESRTALNFRNYSAPGFRLYGNACDMSVGEMRCEEVWCSLLHLHLRLSDYCRVLDAGAKIRQGNGCGFIFRLRIPPGVNCFPCPSAGPILVVQTKRGKKRARQAFLKKHTDSSWCVNSRRQFTINILMNSAFTLLIDSFFWQRTIWPEGCVWLSYPLFSTDKSFSVICNQLLTLSTIYHFLWYFYSALPQCMQAGFCFLFCFGSESHTIFTLHLAAISYVAYLSLIPVKSIWTIVHTLPAFNLVAAWNSSIWFVKKLNHCASNRIHCLKELWILL